MAPDQRVDWLNDDSEPPSGSPGSGQSAGSSFEESSDAGAFAAEEGVITRPGESFPRDLGPVVTLGAVQRYVEAERNRNRRALLWAGTGFLFVVLLILVMFITVGIHVLKHSRRATEIAEDVQDQTAAYAAEVVTLADRMERLQEGQDRLNKNIRSRDIEHAASERAVQADLQKFGQWVKSRNNREMRALVAMEARLQGIEEEREARLREAERIRAQYGDVAAAAIRGGIAGPRLEPEGAAEPAPEPVRETDPEVVAGPSAPVVPEEVVPPKSAGDLFGSPYGEGDEGEPPREPVRPPDPGAIKVVSYPNGDRFEGQFKDGLFHGWGILYYRAGDVFEGEFRDDMREGRGTCTYANGDKYIGDFKADMKHGRGRLIFSNGDVYSGDFRNDMMNGKGTLVYANGNMYAGDFLNGLKHGNGSFRFANGDVYKGEYRHGVRSGRGTYAFADGDRYIGDFKQDEREGYGRYIYAGGEEYRGEFRGGKKDGVGVCVYPNGRA